MGRVKTRLRFSKQEGGSLFHIQGKGPRSLSGSKRVYICIEGNLEIRWHSTFLQFFKLCWPSGGGWAVSLIACAREAGSGLRGAFHAPTSQLGQCMSEKVPDRGSEETRRDGRAPPPPRGAVRRAGLLLDSQPAMSPKVPDPGPLDIPPHMLFLG